MPNWLNSLQATSSQRLLPKLGKPTCTGHSWTLQLCDEEGPALLFLLLTGNISTDLRGKAIEAYFSS